MSNEAGNKHQQNHEQFGPREPATSHLYLQILGTEEELVSETKTWTFVLDNPNDSVRWRYAVAMGLTWHRLLHS